MPKVVGIKFKQSGKIYDFSPNDFELKIGDKVVVETVKGLEIGEVAKAIYEKEETEIVGDLVNVVRIATKKDIQNHEENEKNKEDVINKTKELVEKYKLDMKVIDAEFTLDGSKVIISFVCEERIDFRELVKDLASKLKQRIELRQIGARDQAKIVGGIGSCGKECCCKQYLNDFDKVSIKMAKTQNLSLNPTKISGICGRLMCCLAYENEYYSEVNEKMPKVNSQVKTPDGIGSVMYNNLLKQIVTVKFVSESDVKIETYKLDEIEKLDVKPNVNKGNLKPEKKEEDVKIKSENLESNNKKDEEKTLVKDNSKPNKKSNKNFNKQKNFNNKNKN